jgi:hypothetical protein
VIAEGRALALFEGFGMTSHRQDHCIAQWFIEGEPVDPATIARC